MSQISGAAQRLVKGLDTAAAAGALFGRRVGEATYGVRQLGQAVQLLARGRVGAGLTQGALGAGVIGGVGYSLAASASPNGTSSIGKTFEILAGTIGELVMPAFIGIGAVALTASQYIGRFIDKNLDKIAGGWATAIIDATKATEEFAKKAWGFVGEVAGGERPGARAGLVGAGGFGIGRLLGFGAKGSGLLGAGLAGLDLGFNTIGPWITDKLGLTENGQNILEKNARPIGHATGMQPRNMDALSLLAGGAAIPAPGQAVGGPAGGPAQGVGGGLSQFVKDVAANYRKVVTDIQQNAGPQARIGDIAGKRNEVQLATMQSELDREKQSREQKNVRLWERIATAVEKMANGPNAMADVAGVP